MSASALLVAACSILAGRGGIISGVAVNGSDSGKPLAGAEIVLRAGQQGLLPPIETATADARGRFYFEHLAADPSITYLPGVNRDGVHYPGPRLRLAPGRSFARAELVAYDTVGDPSPLAAAEYELVVRCEKGFLEITESMNVANSTRKTYVGSATGDAAPVTLQLSPPKSFQKITFHKEFFGRHFAIREGKLVTDIPWPPGERELAFTYRLPVERGHRVLRRSLDLPASLVRVRVVTDDVRHVSCNLPGSPAASEGEAVFEAGGAGRPAGFEIQLTLDKLPVPLLASARWIALLLLAGLILGTVLWPYARRRGPRPTAARDRPPGRRADPAHQPTRGKRSLAARRSTRRGRRR